MNQGTNLSVKNLNHLGIIAGVIDEIGLVEMINENLGIAPQEKLNSGQIVKGILLNAMGFVSQPLYLFSRFFEDKATEHLFGEGILPEDFNDDKIGRVLEKLYKLGLSNLFLSIALAVYQKYGINGDYLHLDATSISVEGEYKMCANPENSETKAIKIVRGYSRDGRPDLKQFIMNLIVSGDGDVPLLFQGGNGNDNDKAIFGKILADFRKQVDWHSIMVADSALYSQQNLQLIKDWKWITRVPLSIKAAQLYVREISESEFVETKLSGYRVVEKKSNYGAVEQKWLIVESEARKKHDLARLQKKIETEGKKVKKLVEKLSSKKFESAAEIKAVLKVEQKMLKSYTLHLESFEKGQEKAQKREVYQGKITFEEKTEEIEIQKRSAGRFILATNVLDELDASAMITAYKEQQSSERGFGFIKDPLFFADSVFLKKPERIEAMAMLMAISLLVYTIGQRQLRLNLQQNQAGLKNQLGKRTHRPTLRWIFQCFQGIHLVVINGVKQIANLTDSRLETLNYFSESCQKYYCLSG